MEARNRFLCSLTGRFENRVVVPALHAEKLSLVSIKDLQIRALDSTLVSNKIFTKFLRSSFFNFNGYDPLYFYSSAVPFYFVLLRSFSENM
jgi:hypothetical protein